MLSGRSELNHGPKTTQNQLVAHPHLRTLGRDAIPVQERRGTGIGCGTEGSIGLEGERQVSIPDPRIDRSKAIVTGTTKSGWKDAG